MATSSCLLGQLFDKETSQQTSNADSSLLPTNIHLPTITKLSAISCLTTPKNRPHFPFLQHFPLPVKLTHLIALPCRLPPQHVNSCLSVERIYVVIISLKSRALGRNRNFFYIFRLKRDSSVKWADLQRSLAVCVVRRAVGRIFKEGGIEASRLKNILIVRDSGA